MSSLLSLPTEVLQVITKQLYLPDLGNFATSRLVLSRACKTRMEEHVRLKSFALNKFEKPSYWDDPSYSPNYFKLLLMAVLRQPEMVNYIDEFDASDGYSEDRIILEPDEGALIQKALQESSWIGSDDFCYKNLQRAVSDPRFTEDDPLYDGELNDEVNYSLLSLLPTMLPRLKKLTLHGQCVPGSSANSDAAEDAFLDLYRRISSAESEDSSLTPLPCLTDLHIRYLSMSYAAPLMSLSTVKLVTLEGMIEGNEHNGWPPWPDALPAPQVQELRLMDVGTSQLDDSLFELYDPYVERMPESCAIIRGGRRR